MPFREFRDENGDEWMVWITTPTERRGVADDFRDGWLTFESGMARRRLAPVPPHWETMSVEHLRLALSASKPVARESRRSGEVDAEHGEERSR